MVGLSRDWRVKFVALIATVATLLFAPLTGYTQTATTGAIAGDVIDPTGGSVPNATVTATNLGTGEVRTTTTGTAGHYVVSQLTSGEYKVSVRASGFRTEERGPITVRISQTLDVNFKLAIGKMTETVEVTSGAALIQTQNPNTTTTVGATQLAELPNPGMDLSYVAQVALGAVMNTAGGLGNVEFNGLPATSNNFTIPILPSSHDPLPSRERVPEERGRVRGARGRGPKEVAYVRVIGKRSTKPAIIVGANGSLSWPRTGTRRHRQRGSTGEKSSAVHAVTHSFRPRPGPVRHPGRAGGLMSRVDVCCRRTGSKNNPTPWILWRGLRHLLFGTHIVFRMRNAHQPFIEPAHDVVKTLDAMPWLPGT